MKNKFYSIPHLFSWIPKLASRVWDFMAILKSMQVMARCEPASWRYVVGACLWGLVYMALAGNGQV